MMAIIFSALWCIAMCGWIFCLLKWKEAARELTDTKRRLNKEIVGLNTSEDFGYDLKDYKIHRLESDKMWLEHKIDNLESDLSNLRKDNAELRKYKVDADTDTLIARYRQRNFYNALDRENLEWYAWLRAWFRRFNSPNDIEVSIGGFGKTTINEPIRQFIVAAINNELMSIENKEKL